MTINIKINYAANNLILYQTLHSIYNLIIIQEINYKLQVKNNIKISKNK